MIGVISKIPRLLALVLICSAAHALCAERENARAAAPTSRISKSEKTGITHGPYLTNMTDTSVKINWTTATDCVAWVEIAPDDSSHFYACERPKYFGVSNGKKRISTFHSIEIDGLKPDTKYRYRIFSTEVLSAKYLQYRFGKTFASAVYKAELPCFRTFPSGSKPLAFTIVNDIHQDPQLLQNLLTKSAPKADFIVLNGDMLNYVGSDEKIFSGFLDKLSDVTKGEIPVVFARGNHETRGDNAEAILKFFPTPTGKSYYSFKVGETLFVCLDSGEDKPDSDIEYFGLADFDNFRTRQAKWLETLMATPEYKNAKARIIFCHIPPAWGEWHGSLHFRKLFLPMLKSGNFDLIISGHLHGQYKFYAPQEGGVEIPNIVNGNTQAVDVKVSEGAIDVSVRNQNGEIKNKVSIPIK